MKSLFTVLLILVSCTVIAQPDTIKHKYYTLVYDNKVKAPLYSYYTLTKAHLKKSVKRKSTFYIDPLIPKANQANNKMYKGETNWDKGHLSPAADFCFNKTAYKESMYLSNTAPQQEYFNEHLWEGVESDTRDTCSKYGEVKVFTGCIYSDKKFHGVGQPDYYWKVIIYNNGNRQGWMGENVKPSDNNPDLIITDVKEIERLTKLHFN